MANYLAELERLWQQKRKTDSSVQAVLKYLMPADLERPKALRGGDLVQELVRLAVLTKDARFAEALVALIEHRIVDGNSKFLPWDLPLLARGKERIKRLACVCIHVTKASGRSLRRACADHAARTGWPATSFAAAVKDLELLYRQHPEFVTKAALSEFRIERLPPQPGDGQADLPIPAELLALFGEVVDSTDPTKLENSCSTSIPTTANA
jgi:hypothetical protein